MSRRRPLPGMGTLRARYATVAGRMLGAVGLACLLMVALAAVEVHRSVETARGADDMTDAARRLDQLLALRSALAEEQLVATVHGFGSSTGEVHDSVAPQVSQGRTDTALRRFDRPPIDVTQLELARGTGSFGSDDPSNQLLYRELLDDTRNQVSTLLRESRGAARRLGDTRLGTSLDRLESAAEIDRLSTQVVLDLIDLWFSDPLDAGSREAKLVADRDSLREATAAAAEIEALRPELQAEVQQPVPEFDRLVANAVRGERRSEVDGNDRQVRIGLAEGFERASGVTQRTREQAEGDIEVLASGATSAEWRAIAVAVGIPLVVLLLIWVAAHHVRTIVSPIQRLGAAAERLRWGETRDLGLDEVQGPSEVRSAGEALASAAASLDLLKQKATLIAAGDLADPALAERVPGSIGVVFDEAVDVFVDSVTERLELAQRIEHEACHDHLTGALSRSAILGAVQRGVDEEPHDLAVAHVDVQQFRQLNRVFGVEAADQVLIAVATVLEARAGANDAVGRLGADEFLVVYRGDGAFGRLHHDLARTIDDLGHPIGASGQLPAVGARAGIAEARPADSALDLLQHAVYASDQARANPRGAIVSFDEATRAAVAEDRQLEHELRADLAAGRGLSLVYQPIVDAGTGRPVGVEALCRWTRASHGAVRPDRFIAIAERSDLIVTLDEWVLDTALAQLQAWGSDPVLRRLWMSVNISGQHLGRRSLVPTVQGALQQHRVSGEQLVIEMTETVLATDLIGIAERLQLLRDGGVRVAVDDFGSGFTGLGQLRTLPIDELKLDRSLVVDAHLDDGVATLEVICAYAALLGAPIVAEGIEHPAEAELMARLGVDYLQGYLFAKPMEPDDAGAWLRAGLETAERPVEPCR